MFRDNRKRKIESLDDKTWKIITRNTGETAVAALKKNDDEAVIASIINIALCSSAVQEKRRN